MLLKTRIDEVGTPRGKRVELRRVLRLDVVAHTPIDGESNCVVHNVSSTGILIETRTTLAVHAPLQIELPDQELVGATVVWSSDEFHGCNFEREIGPATLAAIELQGVSAQNTSAAEPPMVTSRLDGGLGKTLYRLRMAKGLTLGDVAAALGVSTPTVWAWEKGKACPLPERLGSIAAVLGVNVEALPSNRSPDEARVVIDDCRLRIADVWGTAPSAIRISIEL